MKQTSDMNVRKLKEFIEETQYFPESISFRREWLDWKLLYCDIYKDGNWKEVIKNIARSVIDYRNHKIVFRSSGSIFCEYIYVFVNDDPKPELPFYMLNKNEIARYCDEFLDRLRIDNEKMIIFETDNDIYEFEGYDDLVEEYRGKTCRIFLEHELWKYIYVGKFDPLSLTEKADSWRRILKVHESVPRA